MPQCLHQQDRDMSNISPLLLSLANCELQAQLRMSGLGLSRDPQQLCNVLIWLMLVQMKSSHLPPHALQLFHYKIHELHSQLKLPSTAIDFLCSLSYAIHTVHANPPTEVTSNLPWVVVMDTVQDNAHSFKAIMRVCNFNRAKAL